jgi:hypothetical protein
MFGRSLLVSFFFLAVLTGCAATSTESLQTRADARTEALQTVPLSRGACDSVGQFIRPASDGMSLQASAAPAP